MSTPITEKEQFSFPAFEPNEPVRRQSLAHTEEDLAQEYNMRTQDEDLTLNNSFENEHPQERRKLNLKTSYDRTNDFLQVPGQHAITSPSQQRSNNLQLEDDLVMLQAERVVSAGSHTTGGGSMDRARSMGQSRSRQNVEPIDDFDVGTTPIHEKTKIYQPPAHPATKFAKVFKRVHESSFIVRWFFYITPMTLLLLIPLLVGALYATGTDVGGVELLWFSIWLQIVWLTLWLARLIAKCIPYPMGLIASLFTNADKKWRDMGKQLEIPATLFFWGLACEVSFLPTMKNHHADGDITTRAWENIVNKIIIALFVGAVLNFLEKILIQLIAISFHTRTYADRIEVNKFQIASLVKLYVYSKAKIAMEDSEFELNNTSGKASGARTPMVYAAKAAKNARQAFNTVGDVAGKVAGDFTGKQVRQSTHPQQVVLSLLSSTSGAQVLARRLHRTYAVNESEVVLADDLRMAFDNNEEADSAFTMFDKDMNGDISMEELEAVCVEIGRERKAITASLKDLDSVVSKLDSVLLFFVAVVVIIVFVSIISTSASGVLTSLGSTLLGLSWLLSATAQEFLQSIIFVFVKHPFDVGDRVTIYGNTGSQLKGDDYFVKEIALLYTEFKKMEGHVVQAPNSYLNTLFILNQRRSGGLAEAVSITVKFGTTLTQIEELRERLLTFVSGENREYQSNILTELRDVTEAYSISLNVIFFYKSNWQNELLRLQRRNKFICALMVTMQDLGIEGPYMNLAGQSTRQPMHINTPFPPAYTKDTPIDSSADPATILSPHQSSDNHTTPQPFTSLRHKASTITEPTPLGEHPSILRSGRGRNESIAAMSKRVDFSLGMSSVSSGNMTGDVFDDTPRPQIPTMTHTSPSPHSRPPTGNESLGRTTSRDSAQARQSSDSGSIRTHRNRFTSFRRARGPSISASAHEGTDLADLEAGFAGGAVGRGLEGIPEATSGVGTPGDGKSRSGSGATLGGRIDPRSGIVSPQAVQSDSSYARGELPLEKPRRAHTALQ